MFTAAIWGAILVYIIDNQLEKAVKVSFVAIILSAIGLIHAPKLAILYNYKSALVYLIMGIILWGFSITLKDVEDENESLRNTMTD